MLQQILKDMYIDPDVLEALNEEQKKILFLKMRQEQVRRWKEREEKLEREGSTALKPKPKKAHSKSVSWLLGRDGDVQVCIIGEADEFKTSKFIYSNLGQTKGSNLQSNTRHQSNTVRSSLVKRGCTEPENLPSQTPPGIQLHFKGVPTESGSDQQPPPPQVSQPEQQPSSSVWDVGWFWLPLSRWQRDLSRELQGLGPREHQSQMDGIVADPPGAGPEICPLFQPAAAPLFFP